MNKYNQILKSLDIYERELVRYQKEFKIFLKELRKFIKTIPEETKK